MTNFAENDSWIPWREALLRQIQRLSPELLSSPPMRGKYVISNSVSWFSNLGPKSAVRGARGDILIIDDPLPQTVEWSEVSNPYYWKDITFDSSEVTAVMSRGQLYPDDKVSEALFMPGYPKTMTSRIALETFNA
jgi:hypothetical protein